MLSGPIIQSDGSVVREGDEIEVTSDHARELVDDGLAEFLGRRFASAHEQFSHPGPATRIRRRGSVGAVVFGSLKQERESLIRRQARWRLGPSAGRQRPRRL